MKKFFYSVLAAATMLFATTSCSQDNEILGGETPLGGNTQKVAFTVQMPDDGVASRAIADGVSVGGGNKANNLIWALYEKGKDDCLDYGKVAGGKNTETGKHEFTAEITMVKGLTYNVLFFAYDDEKCAFQLNATTPEATDLTALTLKNELVANEEGYDAFVKCHEYTFGGETDVELTRPFAQVNAATTVADLDKALKLKAVVTKSDLVIKNVPTKYNVLTGEATENKDLTYQANDILKHYVATGETAPTHPNEDITVKEGDVETAYKYLTMAYVLAGETKNSEESMHNATFNFYRGDNGDDLMRTIDILNLPIQRNWRTNVIGDLLTEEETFKIVIDEIFVDDHIIYEDEIAYVTTGEDLETALKQDLETIIVNLGEEVTSRAEGEKLTFEVNISSHATKAWGADKTKTIIINGNGHTIKFIHNDSDWNWISFKNPETKLFISDAHLTNGGHNDGPWNRHDIRFCNAVELQNVTSDKAIALFADSKLEGVKISDTHQNNSEMYALWIVPQGQTVDINNCEFTAHSTKTGDRGITINNYYQGSDVADVTLNVSNSTFVTQKKAAILYKDDDDPKNGGDEYKAIINWGEGNNIEGVTEDKVYPVWVDEDSEAYYDNVTVTGCSKFLEGDTFVADGLAKGKNGEYKVSNANGLATLNNMMVDKTAGKNIVVNLTADIDFTGKTWTPVDSHADTKFTFQELNGNGHIISNLTINGQAMFKRFAGSGDVTIKDVTFDNATVNSTALNTSILTVQCYQNVLLNNVDVKNSTIIGNYKVAPLIATVYDEKSSTKKATLKDCDVVDTVVKGNLDFMICGMVAWVAKSSNEEISFENCTVNGVTLQVPSSGSYNAYGYVYSTNGTSEDTYNEATGVTVTNCKVEKY